ncbi:MULTISPECIES: ribosomal protein S18-alanine N-acetyltransferase [unclassified Acinetobacter]|uniref:ribosomal protein S18-alanine N-acetyltransferase n=1 Tax=unclassified Acinetobacter TaxID=196816 RepID=UPI002934DB93|nr:MULTISPECIES: ribosomal protein S18-alanine N-acetyltransferase [unclassified Acinetobacter]WOE33002.1 ribosomal protein S18-alanine N-acetyltransferase [Acinetobacter sp. SAAs470]WOE38480.1 ribosomal protein S18-alanine N-acetyltransferase [Acinetobacter sp. SAAs474]
MIRLMTKADVARVTAIENRVQSHPWRATQFEEAVDSYQATVFEIQGQVIGFCILQPVLDEANLLLMAIDPQFQGQGYGFQLLEQSIQMLDNQPVQIFLEVRESNLAAIALYEKNGFHQIDLRKNYYPHHHGTREHAIIMVKSCTDDFSRLFQ